MRRHVRKLHKHHILRDIGIAIVALGFLVAGGLIFWATTLRIPDLTSFAERRVTQSAKIFDRTGQVLLYDLGQNLKRTVIAGDQISQNIKNATIAIEDEHFYEHNGIQPSAILRAVINNVLITLHLQSGFSQGGSTITQQVVKNTLLTTDKKISRKLKEWVLAIKLERVYTKDHILETYLNESPYGGTIYGVEEASEAFFGKAASNVSIAEAAYLAAIPQAPTFYSPHGNNRDRLDARKNLVLQKMLENKMLSQEEYENAKAEIVTFLTQGDTGIKAPHFVFYVRQHLENKYGEQAITDQGLKVITTLDYSLQSKAEEIVKKYATENVEKFNAENASLVAIDPKTGHILAMVGSRDYFEKPSPEGCVPGATCRFDPFVNDAIRPRQPGSSFKPFVYATAFGKGYTPDTVLFDLKTQFSTKCKPEDITEETEDNTDCYSPQNYDDRFEGPITLRNSLAQSRNVTSVKLLYLAGIKESLSTAQDMGITTLEDSDRYGLTLVLGGGEVTLLDMTSAYATFANDGIRNPHAAILQIQDNRGNILEQFTPSPRQGLPQNVARTVSDILSDNVARTPAYGISSPLYFPGRDVAAKTGTTNDSRDAWILGYAPNIAVGAWAGNNDNSPMVKSVAGFIVAPMWHTFMEEALKTLPNEPLPRPDPVDSTTVRPILRGIWQGGETYTIDKFSGKLATAQTPVEARVEKAVQNIHSILHWVNKEDPNGPPPANPANDPQYAYWEYPISLWIKEHSMTTETNTVIPTDHDTIHTGSGPQLSIAGMSQNATVGAGTRIYLSVTTTGPYPVTRVDFYINNRFVGSATQIPFLYSFVPKDIPNIETQNILKIVGYDSVLNRSESTYSFTVKNSAEQ